MTRLESQPVVEAVRRPARNAGPPLGEWTGHGRARLARWLLVAILPLLAHCASAPRLDGIEPGHALPPADSTRLDTLVKSRLGGDPRESAVQLVRHNALAFAYRAATAAAAERSLDVQYYLWRDDLTGKLLAADLLQAAERGVRVRVLIDDMDARTRHDLFVVADLHPNVEVRVFNPFYSRYGSIAKFTEFALRGTRLNRRMHNKAWIADNRVAIVGGRNVGDEYFGASPNSNFADIDVVLAGLAVEQVSREFDEYWNSQEAVPVSRFDAREAKQQELDDLKRASRDYRQAVATEPYIAALGDPKRQAELLAAAPPLVVVRDVRVLADDPDKVSREQTGLEASRVLQGLAGVLRDADQEVLIVSPYFVPGKEGARTLEDAARSGLKIQVLTNSLAATDVAFVHVGYARYRKELLQSGVEFYEMKRVVGEAGGESHISLTGSSGATLHTKALVVDGRWAFVGSMNLDPRSAYVNTEMGVLLDSPEVARQLTREFEENASPEMSYRVEYVPGRGLVWHDEVQGRPRELDHEPDASLGRRTTVTLLRVLPIDPLL